MNMESMDISHGQMVNKITKNKIKPSPNTAYTLRANTLALRDIAYGNVVYAGTVIQNGFRTI
jgi:hypothetical protein